jgi:hypothetical protein
MGCVWGACVYVRVERGQWGGDRGAQGPAAGGSAANQWRNTHLESAWPGLAPAGGGPPGTRRTRTRTHQGWQPLHGLQQRAWSCEQWETQPRRRRVSPCRRPHQRPPRGSTRSSPQRPRRQQKPPCPLWAGCPLRNGLQPSAVWNWRRRLPGTRQQRCPLTPPGQGWTQWGPPCPLHPLLRLHHRPLQRCPRQRHHQHHPQASGSPWRQRGHRPRHALRSHAC